MRVIYNSEAPRVYRTSGVYCIEEIEKTREYRKELLEECIEEESLKGNNNLVSLIKSCPYFSINSNYNRKRVLIEIKRRVFKKGEYSCFNRKFHIDGRAELKTRERGKDNIYYIYILSNNNEGGTEFIKHPFSIDIDKYKDQREVLRYSNKFNIVSTFNLELGAWHKYSEFDWHRGVRFSRETERLFIKITETNYIKNSK